MESGETLEFAELKAKMPELPCRFDSKAMMPRTGGGTSVWVRVAVGGAGGGSVSVGRTVGGGVSGSPAWLWAIQPGQSRSEMGYWDQWIKIESIDNPISSVSGFNGSVPMRTSSPSFSPSWSVSGSSGFVPRRTSSPSFSRSPSVSGLFGLVPSSASWSLVSPSPSSSRSPDSAA